MTGDQLWITIPDWDRFQHYKDRDPLWIKNYTRLLSNWNYLRLTLRQRAILHGLWLLYAESGREVGANPAQLGRILGDDSVRMRDLESLSHAGFLTISASKPLAIRYHSRARVEEETETEELRGSSSVQVTKAVTELDQATPETNGTHPEPTERPEEEIENIKELIEQAMRGAP